MALTFEKVFVMKHRTVRDVMSAGITTIRPSTRYKELVRVLAGQRATGVPVVSDDGQLAGVVSESDLLTKETVQRDPDAGTRPWPPRRSWRGKAAAEVARELMTAPVTVRPDATLAEAARLMNSHHLSCLLVVDEDGNLLGEVTPRDLLRIFLRPDAEIRAEVIDEILVRYLGTNPAMVHVRVTDGVVFISGEVERKSMLSIVLPAIRAVDGVVDVEGQLDYAIDDTRYPATQDLRDY